MSKLLIALLLLFPLCVRAEVVSLDGNWDFTYAPQPPSRGESKVPTLPVEDAFVTRMPVPGYWDDHLEPLKAAHFWSAARFNTRYRKIEFPLGDDPPDTSLLFLQGTGWYRKMFSAPADWNGRLVTLRVGGVREEAWVWVNGNLAGHHFGVSTPFELSLEKWVRAGDANTLVIAVSNSREDRGGSSLGGYHGRSGGIYRPVSIKVSSGARIAGCYLRPIKDGDAVSWNVDLEAKDGVGPLAINWRVRDKTGGRVLSSGTVPVRAPAAAWETPALGMRAWSDHTSNLYQVELRLQAGDRTADDLTQTFGLRRLTRDGTSLRLNGRPVMLRGGTDHHYYPLTTTAPLDVECYRSRIRMLKAVGFNWIRFHTWVPSEEYMQAADELGMMLQVEPPTGFGEQEWIDIVKTCRKHPSVVIYCPGNEEMLDDQKIGFLRKLAELQHTLAPDGLFNPQEAMAGVEYRDVGPDAVERPFPHNPRRLALLQQFSDAFGAYVRGKLSYNSLQGDWRKLDEEMTVYQRPVLSHELGILGNYLNLDLEHRYAGTRTGPDLFAAVRQSLTRAGLLDKAALYYRNSCAWTSLLRKHNLETARRARYIAGYDFLGPYDQNWHRTGYPCGVLNEFFELKPGDTVADILKYNGESVLLLDYTNNRNFSAGDRFRMDLLASLYGGEPLGQGAVRWHMIDDRGAILRRGEWTVKGIRNGVIEKLGTLEFTLPELTRAAKVTVVAQLSGGEYELNNDWNFWVFPKSAPATVQAEADAVVLAKFGARYPGLRPTKSVDGRLLRLGTSLDKDMLAFLEGGGRVLLLGPGPFPALPTKFQMSVTGRAVGNLATIIADHPLMRCFPHDGYCDWQFYSMLEGRSASAINFNDLRIPFDPILEVVSSFKLVRKQASIFELEVGRGRLLVCTLNVEFSDPAAASLLDAMLGYVQSKDFKPRTRVSAGAISCLLPESGR